MRISSTNKIMEFAVIGYQFPAYDTSDEGYDFDANWLLCEIKYADDNCSEEYHDACLLTYELQEFSEAMEKILNKEEEAYISEFMEPYLRIAIARAEDKLVLTMQYAYDTSDGNWKKRTVSTSLDVQTATQVFHELVEFQKTYPERSIPF